MNLVAEGSSAALLPFTCNSRAPGALAIALLLSEDSLVITSCLQ